MRNGWMHIIALILAWLAAGCGGSGFQMTFSLPEDVGGNYDVDYYATAKDGGLLVESTVILINGKSEFKGATQLPTLLYITSKRMKVPVVVYIDRGDKIEVTGENGDPYSWHFGGNKINEVLSDWRRQYADTLAKGDSDAINEAVANFVRENPEEGVSTLLLLTYFSRVDNEMLFRELWGSLQGDKARNRKWVDLVGRSDMLSPRLAAPARFKSMTMRAPGGFLDTLRRDSEGATLLFFWRAGVEGRKNHIDSIRILTKEYPDSTERMIADISIDVDSVAWKAPLKSDSLKTVARFWAPAGFADENLMKLGVERVPFYIVVDTLGNQIYRGEESSEALRVFRTLMIADTITRNQ